MSRGLDTKVKYYDGNFDFFWLLEYPNCGTFHAVSFLYIGEYNSIFPHRPGHFGYGRTHRFQTDHWLGL